MAKLNAKVLGFNISAEISKAKNKDDIGRAMADSIKKTVIDVIRENKRQGGLLRDP